MFPQTFLLREFLVEAEHRSLFLAMHVSCSAAAGSEDGVGRRRREFDAGSRSRGVGSRCDVGRVYALDVACAATAGIVEVGGGERRVGFGDAVGWHFEDFWWRVYVLVVRLIVIGRNRSSRCEAEV